MQRECTTTELVDEIKRLRSQRDEGRDVVRNLLGVITRRARALDPFDALAINLARSYLSDAAGQPEGDPHA